MAPDLANTIVLAATYAKDWLATGAYDEVFSESNLFAASMAAQTASFDTVKVGADWTTRMTDEIKLTFSGAVGHTFAEDELAAQIAFAGGFTGAGVSEGFVQYGARLDYEVDYGASVGVFVHDVRRRGNRPGRIADGQRTAQQPVHGDDESRRRSLVGLRRGGEPARQHQPACALSARYAGASKHSLAGRRRRSGLPNQTAQVLSRPAAL